MRTKVPRNERAQERKFPSTLVPWKRAKVPRNERSWEQKREQKVPVMKVLHMDLSVPRTKSLGYEKFVILYIGLNENYSSSSSNSLKASACQFPIEMLKSNFLDNRLSKRKKRFLFHYRFLIALYRRDSHLNAASFDPV